MSEDLGLDPTEPGLEVQVATLPVSPAGIPVLPRRAGAHDKVNSAGWILPCGGPSRLFLILLCALQHQCPGALLVVAAPGSAPGICRWMQAGHECM